MRPTVLVATACAAVLLLGCGADEGQPTADPAAGSDGALDGPVDGADADADDGGDAPPDEDAEGGDVGDLEAATRMAVADLAASEGIDEAEVEVRSADRVTWSDGALGCPEPGMMYTQALVPGYRIVLAVGGDEVHYHGAEGRAPARCDDPQPPSDAGV